MRVVLKEPHPIHFDEASFKNHPFYVTEFSYAIKTWQSIYLMPEQDAYECGNDRKKNNELIIQYIRHTPSNISTNVNDNTTLLVNPFPFGNCPIIKIKPLPQEAFVNLPTNGHEKSPLYINHELAKQHKFFPIELHMAIEAWTHIFAYAPKDYKPQHKTYKQFIITWLKNNFPGYEEKVYTRISILLNPDKRKK